MALSYVVTFITACVISCLATWLVRELAHSHGWVAAPSLARHVHTRPIPRLGGVAIFTAYLIGLVLAFSIASVIDKDGGVKFIKLARLLIPGMLVFAVGLYDDFKPVKPYVKFSVQALAAVMLFAFGFRVSNLKLFFGHDPLNQIAALALTIFWVMLITNAFNLIDGLDGLAAGSGLFSILVMFVLSLFTKSHTETFAAILLAGAVVGFLRFNFNPATIFLGDSGSLFIGFMLAALSLTGSYKAPTLVAVSIPLVAFGLPITDTVLAVARRFMSGKPLFSADREHIHHKLLERGLSQRQSAIVLYGVSACFGLASIFLLYPRGTTVAAIFFVVALLIFLGIGKLGYHEFTEIERIATRTLEQRQIIVNNLALRRAMHQLKSASTMTDIISTLEAGFRSNDFDGFRLQHSGARPGSDALDYFWEKSSDIGEHGWELRIPLVADRREIGALTIYRKFSGNHLMVDINLLINDLSQIIAAAAIRAAESDDEAAETGLATPAAAAVGAS